MYGRRSRKAVKAKARAAVARRPKTPAQDVLDEINELAMRSTRYPRKVLRRIAKLANNAG